MNVLTVPNGVAVALFGIALSASFCDICWTKRSRIVLAVGTAAILLLPTGLNLIRHPGSHKLFRCTILLDQRGRCTPPFRQVQMWLVYNAGPVTTPGKTQFFPDFRCTAKMPLTVIVSIIRDFAVSINVHLQIKVKGDSPLML